MMTHELAAELAYVIEQYCTCEEWDMPGDTPIVVGYKCLECESEAARAQYIQHKKDCRVKAIAAALEEREREVRILKAELETYKADKALELLEQDAVNFSVTCEQLDGAKQRRDDAYKALAAALAREVK
jgi:hypothetical protein